MKSEALKSAVLSGCFDKTFNKLYADITAARKRYADAIDEYVKLFGDGELYLFSAPGRTEVGGNHTDHQHGCVLAGSVDLDVIAVASATDSDTVMIKSAGYPLDKLSVNDTEPIAPEEGKAISLIRGMCGLMQKAGYTVGGFNAYTTSNVLKGSGLSSSAAFEVLIGNIISGLFNDGTVSPVHIAQLAQKAENIYFGKPSGLMDQMASSVGGFVGIDFADNDAPVIESVSFDLSAQKHCLCIVNTGGDHADLTSDYADVTNDCKKISNHFGKNYLREVDPESVFANISLLRHKYGDRAVMRAIHFFNENDRAVSEKEMLKKGDFNGFLSLVNESGNSSFKYLQNVYSVKSINEQGISLALCLADMVLSKRGAARVHGGGFAGTMQAFVPDDLLAEFKSVMEATFGAGNVYVLNIRSIGGTAITE